MITYIVSFEKQRYVSQAVEETEQAVMNAIVEGDFDFSNFVKQQSEQIQVLSHLLIDLDAVKDSEEDFIQAINNFRMLYKAKIIILASGRIPGDRLLHDIFCTGIYDIAVSSGEELAADIRHCIKEGMTFKDSLKFKTDGPEKEGREGAGRKTVPETREKIIVKSKIQKTASKETIGFSGTQNRIGVTHNAIVCAKYLQKRGFRVALVESPREESALLKIQDSYELDGGQNEYFQIQGISFYPDYELHKLSYVLTQDYNFVVIDFGLYTKEITSEFMRCALPVIVSGSKAWELEKMNRVFESQDLSILKSYYYMFNFTAEEVREEIRLNMQPMEHVCFQDYIPDPFSDQPSQAFDEMLKEYMPEERIMNEKRKKFSFAGFGGVFAKK